FFAGTTGDKTKSVVIDAWARLAHRGGHHRALAEALGMDYLLFDDLSRDRPLLDDYLRTCDKLFVFNQPPIYLLDPDYEHFRCLNALGLESYPSLGCPELFREHLRGRVLFTSSPWTDLLNDKALYVFLPYLVEYFCHETMSLPVIDTRELWDPHDPAKID